DDTFNAKRGGVADGKTNKRAIILFYHGSSLFVNNFLVDFIRDIGCIARICLLSDRSGGGYQFRIFPYDPYVCLCWNCRLFNGKGLYSIFDKNGSNTEKHVPCHRNIFLVYFSCKSIVWNHIAGTCGSL